MIRLVLQNTYAHAQVREADAAVPFAQAYGDGIWTLVVYDPVTCPWAEGTRLIAALRERDRSTAIVAWSADLDADRVTEWFRAGASDVIRKGPDAIVELPRRVERFMQAGHVRRRRPSSSQDIPTLEVDPPSVSDYMPTELPPITGSRDFDELRDSSDLVDPVSIIHDLKEPLRTIHMLLDRCDRRHRDAMPQEAQQLVTWAQRSAQQLSLDLDEWHAELTSQEPSFRRADAKAAFSDALRNLSALAEETGAKITVAHLPEVAVPTSIVRRVFENLLGNAMRHHGQSTPEIHVGVQVLNHEAVFSVRDNGPGIPEAIKKKVFEPGVRGDGPGTGFGLHATRRLVERWGGEIWFDSVRGEGSTFYFRLPLPGPESKENANS
ncbi:MAG: hypothetical protein HC923_10470 [Myxococcales bacterium]|nr:hypothetical protein [Myxococcales bacterium]